MLPVVVHQFLLQLSDPTQFMEEPLVYSRQFVDVIDAHAAVKGLNRRRRTDVNLAVILIVAKFISGRAQITVLLDFSKLSDQMPMKRK